MIKDKPCDAHGFLYAKILAFIIERNYFMKNVHRTMRNILKGLKSEDPEVRLEAIDILQNMHEPSIDIRILLDMIEEAAARFPEPTAEWDDPSAQILAFVCQYTDASFIRPLVKHYSFFSPIGQDFAVSYLCRVGPDLGGYAFIEMLETYLPKNQVNIPLEDVLQQPAWIPQLFPKFISYLDHPNYSFAFYRLLDFGLEAGTLQVKYADEVLPRLLRDYKQAKEAVQKYDQDYQTSFVYHAWRGSYLLARADLCLFLHLMRYYYNDEIEKELQEALVLHDPIIRTYTAVSLLYAGKVLRPEVLFSCAQNLESCSVLYEELERNNKEHLYPIQQNKQYDFAKSHLFYYLIDHEEYGAAAADIEIAHIHHTTNYYGQGIIYYLMKYRSAHPDWTDKGWLTAWVGGYADEVPDGLAIWDGTYTEFVPFESRSIDEHVRIFNEKRTQERQESEEALYYEAKEKMPWVTYYLIFFTVYRWYRALQDPADLVLLGITGALTLYVAWKVWHSYLLRKHTVVHIKGHSIQYTHQGQSVSQPLHEIRSITMEKRKWRKTEGRAFYTWRTKYIVFTDKQGNECLAIPAEYVNEARLLYAIQELTEHLAEPPHILMKE